MSGYYQSPYREEGDGEDFDWTPLQQPSTSSSYDDHFPSYASQNLVGEQLQQPVYGAPLAPQYQQYNPQPHRDQQHQQQHQHQQQQHQHQPQLQQQSWPAYQYEPPLDWQQRTWVTPTVPSNYSHAPSDISGSGQYSQAPPSTSASSSAGPSPTYLAPGTQTRSRPTRVTSFTSQASSAYSASEASRSVSPNVAEMAKYGYRKENGSWSCSYPGCTSRTTFNRGCDLRKHYRRHTKTLFCRVDGCPQAVEGGFSSKKDRARHEAKHNPNVVCEWEGCDRLFSRRDNMLDHIRRVHNRRA